MRDVFGLLVRFGAAFAILLLVSFAYIPNWLYAIGISLILAVVLWLEDRAVSYRRQGWPRWLIDTAVAWSVLYAGEAFFTGLGLNWVGLLAAAGTIGAVELPIHELMISRYGVR